MSNIYQEIWDADQALYGIKAVKKGDSVDDFEDSGYVVVDEKKDVDRNHKVIVKVAIPDNKMASYKRVEKLFNNYTLDERYRETNYPEEQQEVQEFIEAIYKSEPMELARNYVSQQSEKNITDDEWWSIIQRVWFEQYDKNSNQRDLSGFEHVIVGEKKGQGTLGGYHFWYKYFLDEHFRWNNEELDLIEFFRWEGAPDDKSPDIVTLAYKLNAFNYETRKLEPLTKLIGGFWVGPSIEGLMAMVTVRFLPEAFAQKKAIINNVEYKLKMFRSPNDRNLRTFYPEFVRMV